MKPRAAVLLVNLGTPDEPTEVAIRRYLKEFLSDPRVVSTPRLVWWFVLRFFILPRRPKELEVAYQAIWGEDSPIRSVSKKLVRKIQSKLCEENNEILVEFAMTYGKPVIAGIIARLSVESIEQLLVIPLFPQYSSTTTAAVSDKTHRALAQQRIPPELRFIKNYHEHPLYIEAVANSILKNWKSSGRTRRLLFSFHGLPLSPHKGTDLFFLDLLSPRQKYSKINPTPFVFENKSDTFCCNTFCCTDTDIETLNKLYKELNVRSKAGAVSTSLGIAHAIISAKRKGGRIIIENDKGETQELLITGIA